MFVLVVLPLVWQMSGRCGAGVRRSRDEAFQIGTEIAREVTAFNPPPVTLKFEKVYHPCVLLTKKRYVGYMYESPSQVGLQHMCSTHATLALTNHLHAGCSSKHMKSCLLCCAVLCCAVLCCAVLCCAVLCCAVLCSHALFGLAHSEMYYKLH